MQRIDLIIDALEEYEINLEIRLKLFEKAFAAARELRELKPVAWMLTLPDGTHDWILDGQDCDGYVPLYALDEVKHEDALLP